VYEPNDSRVSHRVGYERAGGRGLAAYGPLVQIPVRIPVHTRACLILTIPSDQREGENEEALGRGVGTHWEGRKYMVVRLRAEELGVGHGEERLVVVP
jgi:hypothetical protein